MKYFVATIIVLISLYIIKVDLVEGTIPLAYEPEAACTHTMDYLTVKVHTGDTFYSLFAMYPATQSITHEERLIDFYKLNPHLINQQAKDGELVKLPVYVSSEACKN